jgi:nucleotide-binding universal stress UspA family protein
MKILLPVDGSLYSQKAVRFLLRLLPERDLPEIRLLHVRPPVEAWEVRRFLTADEIADMQRHEGEEELHACRALIEAAGIPYQYEVLVDDGEIADAITRYAEEHGCDYIVMGTHGHTGLQHLLMGSVATDVIHRSKVPVMLVK